MKNLLKNIKDSFYYLQGNYRYLLYYSNFSCFIRKHVLEQIKFRIDAIRGSACWLEGACVHCGCQVPKLTMSNKSCGNNCYPKMMGSKNWENFKKAKND